MSSPSRSKSLGICKCPLKDASLTDISGISDSNKPCGGDSGRWRENLCMLGQLYRIHKRSYLPSGMDFYHLQFWKWPKWVQKELRNNSVKGQLHEVFLHETRHASNSREGEWRRCWLEWVTGSEAKTEAGCHCHVPEPSWELIIKCLGIKQPLLKYIKETYNPRGSIKGKGNKNLIVLLHFTSVYAVKLFVSLA